MPPTIRRFWHDCWKKGATESYPGVDYICFAHPASLSESRVSAPRAVLPCARLYCRHRRMVHEIHKSVVLYNVPSTTRAALVAAQLGTTQVAGKEGSICLIPKPEIAGGIDRKSPASDRKRRRESLHNVSTCWTVLLSSLRTCGR